MSRGLTSGQVSASSAAHRIVVPLFEGFYDSGTLRLAICQWDIQSGSDTYIGVGPLVSAEKIVESATSVENLKLALSALDPAVITIATSEPYQGRVARILKAYIDPTTHSLIGTPKVIFPARMRSQNIVEQNGQATVTVVLEHYDADFDRAWPLRFSDSDEQRRFPGDLGCQYAGQMTERNLVWPSKEALRK